MRNQCIFENALKAWRGYSAILFLKHDNVHYALVSSFDPPREQYYGMMGGHATTGRAPTLSDIRKCDRKYTDNYDLMPIADAN